ncbi:type I restriction-modification system, specificity subunit S [Sulfuriferula multivorans]|uniref:Type I restriction-modification system, specificity subunit S n=1 Tax=Sulfuriferula multivorans TaxID=1559896 RepID=A0A401JAR0_9PROT|nr:restriction endonuclease subunit S [Sulfuriferula multivorans]GBL44697.1 type I restriction-modification system, specificity subunit S [Sulfuriferula multivorans]
MSDCIRALGEGEGMSEWQQVKISDVCDITRGGSPRPIHDYLGSEGTPWVKIADATASGSRYIDSTKECIRKEGESKSRVVYPGDFILSNSATPGLPRFMKIRACIHDGWMLLREFKGANDLFMYYLLLVEREALLVQGNGSIFTNLKTEILKNHVVNLPPLPEQEAIAAVLSSLDDKIDLLHRQNQTLEAMAATLFRKWFVEEAQEDWEVVALEDVTSRITDGAHASPSTVEVGLPMASVKDMYQWGINTASCRQISQEDFDELVRTDCRPLKNDILIAKDGSYLKHVFVAEDDMDVVILSSIAILRPNEKYHPLLLATFLKLDSTGEGLANIVTGAVIPRIVLKDFRKYKLLLPPKHQQDQAIETIQPIYEKCWENDRQIRTLKKLRDTLLPKLMSGEVRVA